VTNGSQITSLYFNHVHGRVQVPVRASAEPHNPAPCPAESGPPLQLAAGLDAVQQAADLLGQELQQLHATFPGITKAQLQGVLLKCRKYQQAAKDQQAQLVAMSAAADQERQRLQVGHAPVLPLLLPHMAWMAPLGMLPLPFSAA
jgi:hypothetical protein